MFLNVQSIGARRNSRWEKRLISIWQWIRHWIEAWHSTIWALMDLKLSLNNTKKWKIEPVNSLGSSWTTQLWVSNFLGSGGCSANWATATGWSQAHQVTQLSGDYLTGLWVSKKLASDLIFIRFYLDVLHQDVPQPVPFSGLLSSPVDPPLPHIALSIRTRWGQDEKGVYTRKVDFFWIK